LGTEPGECRGISDAEVGPGAAGKRLVDQGCGGISLERWVDAESLPVRSDDDRHEFFDALGAQRSAELGLITADMVRPLKHVQ